MAKSLEFYIWVANDTLIGCNVQMVLPTVPPSSLLQRGVLSCQWLTVRAGSMCGSGKTKKGDVHEGQNNRKRAHTLPLSTIYAQLDIKAPRLLQNKMQQRRSTHK